jgi:hypothetical protein
MSALEPSGAAARPGTGHAVAIPVHGLRGEGTAVAPHGPDGSYTFDYDLG